MILKNTVFVLGAGASVAYGFPSGFGLLEAVLRELNAEASRRVLQEVGFHTKAFEHQKIMDLARELDRSGQYSVDAFLERRPDFSTVAKAAMAMVLMPLERDDGGRVRPIQEGEEHEDWYRYLFARLLPRSPNELGRNRLSVITFNFDRSFERAFFLSLMANYGVDHAEAVRLAKHVQVIHVHGRLGAPSWLEEDQLNARPYGGPCSWQSIAACASMIHVIHEEIPGSTLQTAQDWLSDATEVVFLGFGYHRVNLQRLGAPGTLNRGDVTVHGTIKGMPAGERSHLSGLKSEHPLPRWFDGSILQWLKENELIHGE